MFWRRVVATAGATRRPTDRPEPASPAGFRGSFSGYERDVFFYNSGRDAGFYEMGFSLGLDFADDGRAFIPLDVDGDGDLDLPVASLQRLRLMENTLPRADRHFARLRLRATRSQHHALGAHVVLEADGVRQQDYVKATAGFQTQVPLDLHFGLGAARSGRIDRVTVRWPSGHEETHRDLPIDKLILMSEGETPKPVPLPSWPADRPRAPRTYDLAAKADRVDGGNGPLASPGRPVVVNFWAPWCKPCQRELPVLRGVAEALGGGVEFVGVSVETRDQAGVRDSLRRHGLPYPQFFANDTLMASFFGGDGEAPLPSTFVFDGRGELRRAFYREVARDDLTALIESLGGQQVSANYIGLAAFRAMQRGDLAEARRGFEEALAANPRFAPALLYLGVVERLQGRLNESVQRLSLSTEIDPHQPQAWHELAQSHEAMGNRDETLRCRRRAAELRPVAEYLVPYARALGAAGSKAEAAQVLERAAQAAPARADVWIELGRVRLELGRPDAAEALQRAVTLAPGHPEATRLLALANRPPPTSTPPPSGR